MENKTFGLKTLFHENPINALIIICAHSVLNTGLIFHIYNKLKHNKEIFKMLFSLIESNESANLNNEIIECLRSIKLELLEDLTKKLYPHNWQQELINEEKNNQLVKIIKDSTYKDKFFIDKFDLSHLTEYLLSYYRFDNWDIKYLIGKLHNIKIELLAENSHFKWSSEIIEEYSDKFSVYVWRKLSKRSDFKLVKRTFR